MFSMERPLRTPLAVVVLGLLAEEPLHPYALRRRIRDRAHDRLPGVRVTSLYDVVRRLAAASLISPHDRRQEGRRPERVEYSITAAGRATLAEWVAQSLADTATADQFPAALSFMYTLSRDQVVQIVIGRGEALAASIDADEAALAAAVSDGIEPIFLSEHRYQLALRHAEHTWLATFTDALQSDRLRWPPPQPPPPPPRD
jgi:DNA-binding PadR family transcriptional regulator